MVIFKVVTQTYEPKTLPSGDVSLLVLHIEFNKKKKIEDDEISSINTYWKLKDEFCITNLIHHAEHREPAVKIINIELLNAKILSKKFITYPSFARPMPM